LFGNRRCLSDKNVDALVHTVRFIAFGGKSNLLKTPEPTYQGKKMQHAGNSQARDQRNRRNNDALRVPCAT
jgi:hypothetical protein